MYVKFKSEEELEAWACKIEGELGLPKPGTEHATALISINTKKEFLAPIPDMLAKEFYEELHCLTYSEALADGFFIVEELKDDRVVR